MRALIRSVTLLVALGAGSCARAPVAVSRERVEPQAAKAEAAIAQLRAKLLTRVTEVMGQGGPVKAIEVCSTEALALTGEIGRAQGIELGRTSFRVRNPANAPRPWAADTVSAGAGLKAADARPALFDLGDRIGVLQPMPVGAVCLTCHGAVLPPGVAEAVKARYPDDRAIGFAEGDLRGFFWAEVPRG
jgi:Protein of unknown function (DUF3365)